MKQLVCADGVGKQYVAGVVVAVVRICGTKDRLGSAVEVEVLRLSSSDRLRMTVVAVSRGRPLLLRVWFVWMAYGLD